MTLFGKTKASQILEPPPFKNPMWDDIAKRYRARLEADAAKGIESAICELAALNAPEKERVERAVQRAKATKASRPQATGSRAGVSRPTYDPSIFVEMYVNKKMLVKDIAAEIGCDRATVSAALTRAGVRRDAGHAGSQRSTHCGRGHSMEDAIELKKGGRACRTCTNQRKRDDWQKKKAAIHAKKAALEGK